jgi:glyoxylase-like metal-dependent hydrolase (beta-lactamase superfamily II)
MTIPFDRDLDFEYGVLQNVAPGIRRIVANNPSPFTFHGTGTYVIGTGEVAVIDPGPDDEEHIAALLAGLGEELVSHILITHTHRDHSPGAALLKPKTPALIYGFGPHGTERASDGGEIEEGADRDFTPDLILDDRATIGGPDWFLEVVHTPGHCSNHLCFRWPERRALFCGDHVMGWSTTVIAPPDGDMADYLASLDKILEEDDETYWPTHGPCISNPAAFVRAIIEHRVERERQILACLADGHDTIAAMVPAMYEGLDPRLHGAAARSVLAHLVHLVNTDRTACDGAPDLNAQYRIP